VYWHYVGEGEEVVVRAAIFLNTPLTACSAPIYALTIPKTTMTRRAVERAVRARVRDWRSLLTTQVQDGRELLRRTLVGPMKFTPIENGYRFEGEAAIGRLLEGIVSSATLMASPAGFEPALPA
jgi:hypothetical protein